MVTLSRLGSTNLYLIDGVDPVETRFAFVARSGGLGSTLSLPESFAHGCFAFFRAADAATFLAAGTTLLATFDQPGNEGLKLAWFGAPDVVETGLILIRESPGGPDLLKTIPPIHVFHNYGLDLPSGGRFEVASDRFRIIASNRPALFRRGGRAIEVPDGVVEIPLLDDRTESGQVPIGASGLKFSLRFTDRDDGTHDLDVFDVGLRFFQEAQAGGATFTSDRFALFEKSRVEFTAFLNPLEPRDPGQTYLRFRRDATLASPRIMPSTFRTTLGHPIKLLPTVAAQPFEEAKLVFAHKPGFDGENAADPGADGYLVPSGPFLLAQVPRPTPSGNGQQRPARLLCGDSGSEFLTVRDGDLLRFVPGHAAFFRHADEDQPGGGQGAAPGTGPRLEDKARTAWVSLAPGNGEAVQYRAQPDDSPLYALSPIDPDLGQALPSTSPILDFQQIPIRNVGPGVVFPMAPPDGFRPDFGGQVPSEEQVETATVEYVSLEARILNPDRRDVINTSGMIPLPPLAASGLAEADNQTTTTPQGLVVLLSAADLAYDRLVLGKSEPEKPGDPEQFLTFTGVGGSQKFVEALRRNKLFLVMDRLPSQVDFSEKISVLGWEFTVPLKVPISAPIPSDQALLIFKFYDGKSLEELAQNPKLWANGEFTGPDVPFRLQAYITELKRRHAEAAADRSKKVNVYEKVLRQVVQNPNWSGILATNLKLDARSIPSSLRGLTGGIELDQFRAHHLGINASHYDVATGIKIDRSSIFALVDYRCPQGATLNTNKEFDYSVKFLQILFDNSAITRFDAEVEFGAHTIFKQSKNPPNDPLLLIGTYERRNGVDVYTFVSKVRQDLTFGGKAISKIEVDKVQLVTEIEDAPPSAPQAVRAKFTLFGGLELGKGAQEILCFDRLGFSDLGVAIDFQIKPDNSTTDPVPTFLPGMLRFDLSKTKACALSFLGRMPLELRSFFFSLGNTNLTLPDLGFLPIGAGTAGFDYGLGLDLDLGSLGALVSNLKGFRAQLLVGWEANCPRNIHFGIRLPDGRKEIAIQGVIKIVVEEFRFGQAPSEVEPGKSDYYLVFKDCWIQILGKRFPPNKADKFNIFLFPDPRNPLGSKVGWWGSYDENDDFFVGLGQRIKVEPPQLAFDAILDVLKAIKIDDTFPPNKAALIHYNPQNKWSAAAKIKPFDGLTLGVVFNDPFLYALQVQFLGGFKFEVAYRKINDEIGVYYADIALPDAVRQIEAGAMSITLPNFAIEVYTNGDFKVDLGFPANLDFARSFKFQILPFVGAGGFYLGKLTGETSTLLPNPAPPAQVRYGVVAIFGLGLRVGLGKEMQRGIFSFGVSVSVYGILEGALAYQDGASNPLVPTAFVLRGRVGILAMLFGSVDFGIVKAGVTIVIEIGIPFTIQLQPITFSQDGTTVTESELSASTPGIEANVSVDVVVVIGRIKIFGKKIEIKISFSFRMTIRLDFPIEIRSRVSPLSLTSSLDVPSPVDWKAANLDVIHALSAAGKMPLPLEFLPSLTVAPPATLVVNSVPQIVALLGLEHGTSAQPEKPFDRLAAAIWLAAFRCHRPGADWIHPRTIPTTRLELEALRDRLLRPRTLARTPAPEEPFDYPKIVEFLSRNFIVTVQNSPDDATPTAAAFFPMIPDLELIVEKEGLTRPFGSFNPQDSAYEDELDRLFENMLLRLDPETSHPAADRTPRSFATLVFEQYFDVLCSAINDVYIRRFQEEERKAGDPSLTLTLGDLLEPAATAVGTTTYDTLAGVLTNNLYSGLRVPRDVAHPDDLEGFYVRSGQQFAVATVPADGLYPVRLTTDLTGSALWFTFPTGAMPEFSEFDTADLPLLVKPENLPDLPARVDQLPPLNRSDRRYSFPEGIHWKPDGRFIWPFSIALLQGIADLGAENVPPTDISIDLRRGEEGGDPKPDDDPEIPRHLATLVPLDLRRVADRDSTPQAEKFLPSTYEIGGATEDHRVLLDQLLDDPQALAVARLSLLRRTVENGEPFFISDSIPTQSPCGTVLFKTNLSTESRPQQVVTLLSEATAEDLPAQAAISESGAFLRLVWECSIVNSGGYYLHYEPSAGADPLAVLFGEQQKIQVFVLIEYDATAAPATHTTPLGKTFINAVVTQPLTPPAEPRPFLYAKLRRKVGSQFPALAKFDEAIARGCVGFAATRDRVVRPPTPTPEQEIRHSLENLFSRLAFRASTPPACRSFPFRTAVGPKTPADASNQLDATKWHYEQLLPLFPTGPDASHYVGIGGAVGLSVNLRDIYGNEHSANTLRGSLAIRYFDAIVAVSEWPGVVTWVDVDHAAGRLVVRLRCFTGVLKEVGSADFKEDPVRRRYETILDQLADGGDSDSVPSGRTGSTAWVETSLQPVGQWLCKKKLLAFIRAIISDTPAGVEAGVDETITLDGLAPVVAPDFYEFFANIVIERRVPAGTEDACFEKVQDPWEASPRFHEPARRAASRVGAPGLGRDDGVRGFAAQFHALYQGLKLAIGVGQFGEKAIWVLNGEKLRPTIEARPTYFAPAPLSGELQAGVVNVEDPNDETKTVERQFSEIDQDKLARFSFETIEKFLSPETSRHVICLSGPGGEADYGRLRFQDVMNAKRRIAAALPGRIVRPLYAGVQKDANEAIEAYKQRVLLSLDAAYGIETIPQFSVESWLTVDPVDEPGGVNLFGEILADPPSDSAESTPSISFSEAKVKLKRQGSAGPIRSTLTILADASKAQAASFYQRSLTFRLTHVEHDIFEGSGGYQPSRWLALIDPIPVPITPQPIAIPIPLREFPLAPQMVLHRAGQVPPGPNLTASTTIEEACRWDYEVLYKANLAAQDEVDLEVKMNTRQSSASFAGLVEEETLIQALVHFREAFPEPEAFFTLLRTQGVESEKRKALKHFRDRVASIAQAVEAGDFVARDASLPEETLSYTASEVQAGGLRTATICWKTAQPLSAEIEQEPIEVAHTPGQTAPGPDATTCFAVSFTEADDMVWRGRLVRVLGLNVLLRENARASGRIVRNRNLRTAQDGEVAESFLYRTARSELPSPLTPLVDVAHDVPIPRPPGAQPSIKDYLKTFFAVLFQSLPGAETRRVRMEARFAFDATPFSDAPPEDAVPAGPSLPVLSIPVASPARLCPPIEVSIGNPTGIVDTLGAQVEAWHSEYRPSDRGRIVFDLMVYSTLGDPHLPILRLRKLTVPVADVSWPGA
jgi:hypothetical protein